MLEAVVNIIFLRIFEILLYSENVELNISCH